MPKSKYACQTLTLMHILGKKWTIPVIEALYSARGKVQFNNLQLGLGPITPKNLSRSLNDLIKAEMIKRVETGGRGLTHTSYVLTKKGTMLQNFILSAKELGVCVYGIDPSCTDKQCINCISTRRLPR